MRTSRLAGVAVVALIASGEAGIAGDNTIKDQSSPPPAATTPDQRYEALLQRVDALENALQASETQRKADHAVVSSLKPSGGWWDNTRVGGQMFMDLTYVNNKNAGVESSSNGTSFDIKRGYVTVEHEFDKMFSANLTTDVTYVSADSNTQVFVKYAYLQTKFDDALIVRLGSADTPWVPYVLGLYGYRYIETNVVDRTKFGTSADWGVHVLGKLADGLVSYQFSAVSGAGFKKPIRTEGVDFEGRVGLNYEGFQLGVGGYSGKEGTLHNVVTHHTYQRFNALAAYTASGLRVGVEYFSASNKGNETNIASTHGIGYSTFASYQFDPQWSVFGRFDNVRPYSQDAYHKAFRNTYYHFGASYTPVKGVDLALVYKDDAGSKGSFVDSNGTIGGAFATDSTPGTNGVRREIGLFTQIKW